MEQQPLAKLPGEIGNDLTNPILLSARGSQPAIAPQGGGTLPPLARPPASPQAPDPATSSASTPGKASRSSILASAPAPAPTPTPASGQPQRSSTLASDPAPSPAAAPVPGLPARSSILSSSSVTVAPAPPSDHGGSELGDDATENADDPDDVSSAGEGDEVPDDLQELSYTEQQKRIKFRSAWMITAGTALCLLFSDPMVAVLSEFGTRTGINAL